MKNFKLSISFLIAFILSALSLQSQVYTTHLTEKQKIQDFFPYPLEKEMEYYRLPDINFERVLEEDRRKGITLHRAAVKVDQNYTLEDGVWAQHGDIMIWQIGFSAPKARSLNFLITDLVLPKGSEMYMISKDQKIVHGPILPEMIYEKSYASDIIESKDARIIVKTDIQNMKNFSINVAGVCQGIHASNGLRWFGDSAPCNFDVNCVPQGDNWHLERDAVALIIKNGEWWCSGALINNQCQNLRGFFLTAFHCLDDNRDGQLQAGEQNLNLYTYRFKYEAGNPLCPGQQPPGGNQGNWFVIPGGAVFRSANAGSDFALIELNGNINHPQIALAGWNRANQAPTSTTIIHHPAGDAKKITFDNNPAAQAVFSGANCWNINSDVGGLEGGASGAPYFDQNRRVIGQHFGRAQDIRCPGVNQFGGRFDLSWAGDGNDATRLSNWLGGANPPMTMNTIRATNISPFVPNNGAEYVCTTNKLFTLNDPIPGTTVTWSVSNPALFATSGGASTSGTGTNATLRAASAGASGSAVLTFTMNGAGCGNPINITRQIWIGRPGLPVTSPSGTTPVEIGVSQYHTVYLSATPGASSFTADWTASGAVSRIGGNVPASYATFVGNYEGTGNWQVTTSNVCGTNSNFGQYNVTNNCNPCPRIIVNNPVQNELIAVISDYHFITDTPDNTPEFVGDFMLFDQNGMTVKSEKFNGNQHTTNVQGIKSGLYILKMKSKDFDLTEKVIIIK